MTGHSQHMLPPPPPPRTAGDGHSHHDLDPGGGRGHSHHGVGGDPPTQTPTLPFWLPPAQTSQVPRDHLNNTGTAQSRRTATVSAEGTVLPILYGEDIVGPIVSLVNVSNNIMTLRCLWCLGEVDAIESVTLEDGTNLPQTTMTHYTGRSDQPVDPYLASIVPGYADTCVIPIGNQLYGVCYSVIRVQARANVGFPRFVAKIRGRKVRDPRGINYYDPTIDGDFNAVSGAGRAKIGFDGTYHTYTSAPNTQAKLTASLWADSAVGTFICAFKPTNAGDASVIFSAGNDRLQIIWQTGGFIRVLGKNAASTTILDATSTVALLNGVDHSLAVSWDLTQNLCTIITDGVDTTPGSYTATSGQVVNLAATNVSIGGAFAGTNLHNGRLSGLGFNTQWIDLRTQAGKNLVLDGFANVLYPPWAAGNIWMPYGYAFGFTYTNTPATVSDPGLTWTTVGTVDKDRFVYPGLGGGLFYVNNVADAGFYLKANALAVQALGAVPHGVYLHDLQYYGGVKVVASASGDLFSLSGTGEQDQVVATTPQGAGENYTIKLAGAAIAAVRLLQFNLFPEPQSYETRWLGEIGSAWTVSVGTVTLADAVIGGIQSTGTATIGKVTPIFVVGEEVFYSFEVSGTFTGSITLNIGGNAIPVTAPGLYTGSTFALTSALNFGFAISSGTGIVKRLGMQTKTAAKVWTKTPALILADLIESQAYGLGGVVNDTSLLAACKFNEFLIYENGTARHQIGLTLLERTNITSWIETLRAYARCFVVPRGSEYMLVPDAPGTVVGNITATDMISGSFKPQKKSLRNLPNVVKVYYTNTATSPWTEDFVEAVAPAVNRGEDYRRESSIRMPGIQTRAMAYRIAIERLNDSTLIDLVGGFTCKDSAWKYEVGDLITVTHPVGLASKVVRILSADPGQRGEFAITFSEYDVNVYSDAIVDDPPPPDYGGGTPFNVPPVTGLRLEETFFLSGGSVGSQLEITWNDIQYAFLQFYVVEVYELPPPALTGDGGLGGGIVLPDSLRNIAGQAGAGGVILGQAGGGSGQRVATIPPGGRLLLTYRTPDTFYNYRPTSAGAVYYIRVYAVSVAFVSGDAASAQITALGYTMPPDFSDGQIVVYEAGDGIEAYVRTGALDIDLWGYEFRVRELSDQNLAIKLGPNFNSADWSGSTSNYTWSSHSMVCLPVTSSDFTVTVPDTGIVVGKSYDVYCKVKSFTYPVSLAGVGLGIGGQGALYSGPASGFIWLPSDTTVPGIYKSRHPWTPTGNGNITFGTHGHSSGLQCFELEYVAFRETEGGTQASGTVVPNQVDGDWDTAVLIQRAASTACRVPNLPSGGYMVYCKALDQQRSVQNPYGQYSDDIQQDWTRVQVDDTQFFRVMYPLTFASAANVGMYPKPNIAGYTYTGADGTEQVKGTWAPDDGQTFNTTFSAVTINSRTTPMWGAFEGASPETWTSMIYDLGATVRGQAKVNAKIYGLGDPARLMILNIQSSNSSTMIGAVSHIVAGADLVTFTGRYLRVVSTMTGNQIGLGVDSSATLEVIVTPRAESGTGTTLGPDVNGDPQPVTVTTQNAYSRAVSVRAWAQGTSDRVDFYCDNIVVGNPTTFTVVGVDINGIPIAAAFNWEFRGV